jgi:hypothetical protein
LPALWQTNANQGVRNLDQGRERPWALHPLVLLHGEELQDAFGEGRVMGVVRLQK